MSVPSETPARTRRAVRVAIVVGIVLLALWGPWRVQGPDQPAVPVDPGDEEGAPASGVHGEVLGISDVEGLPDVPITEGFVVVLPEGGATEVWESAGAGSPQPHELPYLGADVGLSVLEEAGGVMVPIDDGRFELDTEPGDHLLCLARGHHPVQLRGCAPVSLGGDEQLLVTTGEGGVEVRPLD